MTYWRGHMRGDGSVEAARVAQFLLTLRPLVSAQEHAECMLSQRAPLGGGGAAEAEPRCTMVERPTRS